jgi:hypothetical protein
VLSILKILLLKGVGDGLTLGLLEMLGVGIEVVVITVLVNEGLLGL